MQDTAAKQARSVSGGTQDVAEDIRRRAYELYEQRGRQDGHDVEDWVRAEEEVTRNRRRTAA